MFSNISWTEMLVVAVVAIIVVGPKDLPGMLRTFGSFVKKMRGMAGDFQRQFDEAIREAELDGVKDTLKDVRSLDPTKKIKDSLNPLKSELDKAQRDLDKDIDPAKLFDEQLAPEIEAGQKVDVEAALAKQRQADEAAAKAAAAKSTSVKKKPAAKRKSAATKPKAGSVSAKTATQRKAPGSRATKPKAKAT